MKEPFVCCRNRTFLPEIEILQYDLRGSVCKSGPVHSGSKNSLPSNFAQ